MLWIKAWHIIFMVAWYAGLLYLPRLFVYHALCNDQVGNERFKVMERKLFIIMSIGGIGTLLFGGWMLITYAWTAYASTTWLPAKLILITGLIAYHVYCGKLLSDFRVDRNRFGHRFYRLFNEVPALLLIAIVILAVVKPV